MQRGRSPCSVPRMLMITYANRICEWICLIISSLAFHSDQHQQGSRQRNSKVAKQRFEAAKWLVAWLQHSASGTKQTDLSSRTTGSAADRKTDRQTVALQPLHGSCKAALQRCGSSYSAHAHTRKRHTADIPASPRPTRHTHVRTCASSAGWRTGRPYRT